MAFSIFQCNTSTLFKSLVILNYNSNHLSVYTAWNTNITLYSSCKNIINKKHN